MARFEKIPVGMVAGLEGMLTFEHAGLEQSMADIHVTMENPNPKVDFKIYETTAEKPKWTITLRHVDVLEWSKDGANVQDKYTIQCAGDRIWLGTGDGDKRVTMAFAVPEGIEQINYLNLAPTTTRLEPGTVLTGTPVFPGERTFLIAYMLPVVDGKLRLVLKSAADIEQVLVHIPADKTTVTATGLAFQKTQGEDGSDEVREYTATAITGGKSEELAVSGIGLVESPPWSAQKVAIVGGVLLVLCGVGVLFLKKPKSAAEAVSANAEAGAKPRGNSRKMKP